MGRVFQNHVVADVATSYDRSDGIDFQKAKNMKPMEGKEHSNGRKMEEVRS